MCRRVSLIAYLVNGVLPLISTCYWRVNSYYSTFDTALFMLSLTHSVCSGIYQWLLLGPSVSYFFNMRDIMSVLLTEVCEELPTFVYCTKLFILTINTPVKMWANANSLWTHLNELITTKLQWSHGQLILWARKCEILETSLWEHSTSPDCTGLLVNIGGTTNVPS